MNNFLLIVVEVLLAYVLYDGIVSGKVLLRGGLFGKIYERRKYPKTYWFSMVLTAFLFVLFGCLLMFKLLETSHVLNQPTVGSLEEYDARLMSACAGEKSDKQSFATCAYTLMLNDEMATGSIKTYAQQEQFALNAKEALDMSNENLKSELVTGLSALAKKYDTELGLKMSAYLTEYSDHRRQSDLGIDSLVKALFKKYGPCWGIPTGQCRE